MIIVPMNNDGRYGDDRGACKKRRDHQGMWAIPMYSNPTGISFSDDVVRRLARMETKAKDFTIIWDNAYALHHLYDEQDSILSIIDECKSWQS